MLNFRLGAPPFISHIFNLLQKKIEKLNNMQIRDITTNPDWEKAYQYEIPVLAILRTDGVEVCL